MKLKIVELIKKQKIIPVIRVDSYDLADKIIRHLYDNGVHIIEITLSIPNAYNLMNKWASQGMIVGAGTVFTLEQARLSIKSNVSFIVSPIIVEGLVDLCHLNDIPCAIGALTPNEIMEAVIHKADIVKVFPIKSMGGADYMKSIKDVYPEVLFMPTGGINSTNLNEYLKVGITLLGVGNSLVSLEDVKNNQLKEVYDSINEYFNQIKEI